VGGGGGGGGWGGGWGGEGGGGGGYGRIQKKRVLFVLGIVKAARRLF